MQSTDDTLLSFPSEPLSGVAPTVSHTVSPNVAPKALSIIVPGQKIAGWPSLSKAIRPKAVRRLTTDSLVNILATHWREDVHFTQYAVSPLGNYRYNNDLFNTPEMSALRSAGGCISIIAIALDIDSPAKKSGVPGAVDIWWEEERPKVLALREAHPGCLVWRTKGGYRVVWYTDYSIRTPDDTLQWKKNYLTLVCYVKRQFGILADSACNDWNRLHRVPFGIRDNEPLFGHGEPIIRETIGILDATYTFDPVAVCSEEDRNEARRVYLKSWKEPLEPKSKAVGSAADIGSTAVPIYDLAIKSVWERLLGARSAIVRELSPGKLAVVCANSSAHTSNANNTSTVLYAPGAGEYIGHIFCAHEHCSGLSGTDLRGLYGISPEEWAGCLAETLLEVEAANPPPPTDEAVTASLSPGALLDHQSNQAFALCTVGKDGMPDPIAANIAVVLMNHPQWTEADIDTPNIRKSLLAYDNFQNDRVWVKLPAVLRSFRDSSQVIKGRILQTEADLIHIQGWLRSTSPRLQVTIADVRLGVHAAAMACQYDSLQDHAMSYYGLWDGTPRIDTWLIDYMGAKDTPITRTIGRRYLMAMMARAMLPGCVADMIMILEGLQGIGKTRMFETLFGDDYVGTTHAVKLGSKDFIQKTSGTWCFLDDELVTFTSCNWEEAKAWLSIKQDTYRKAYGIDFIHAKRRFVCVGTTNRTSYLQDIENRRVWPVEIHRLDLKGLEAVRDQLLSEALAYFMSRDVSNADSCPWILRRDDAMWDQLTEAHHSRRLADGWEELLADNIARGTLKQPFTMNQALDSIQMPNERRTMSVTLRVSKVLREVLKYDRKQVRLGDRREWYWVEEGTKCVFTTTGQLLVVKEAH